MILTHQYRIKDSCSYRVLGRMSGAVNFAFNYCNETSIFAIKRDGRFLSGFDLSNLIAGCSKELGLHSQTLQKICEEYVTRRKQFKKRKLNWRSAKRNTGWIPFKASGIKLENDKVTYCGHVFKLWFSRNLPDNSKIKEGSFTCDRRGRWYVNLQIEVPDALPYSGSLLSTGIDLGLKTHMTLSDGSKFKKPSHYRDLESKLAMAQRAGKKSRVKAISAKIANKRKDWLHHKTTKIVNNYGAIYVGNVSSKKLAKTNMAKSVYDASWRMAKTMLDYKSQKLGKVFEERNEAGSTCTCSACLKRTGPRGLRQLDIREWVCSSCKAVHDRDTNAAMNIHHPPSGASDAKSGITVSSGR